ncbi:DMT family transporter [Halobacteriovorax sp. GB3]|uniref:DMT family transporter n=1 Tax=Halobacteriovorax sp. GB3 TaxID=2719615 RepID=UPI00236076DC|nr:DMT family transporter [Halobacteriovorax sp. GB3]MDD0851892.1 DMT family transporter [Halobacteriovorax sp. GB3]
MRFGLLIIATLIWGMGFVGTRWTLVDYSPLWSNSLRYVFAALFSLPFLMMRRTIKDKIGPIICSVLLLTALQLQTYGIEMTTLAKSGFLTVFYSIFTPILTYFFFKQRFKKGYWFLLAGSLFGIMLLCEFKIDNINMGDIITIISAFFFALHILAVDKYAAHLPAVEFNLLQCFYMGVLGLIFGLMFEGPPNLKPLLDFDSLVTLSPSPLLGFIILSIFSSIIAFSFQVFAQQGTPPHIVSLAFLLESIFAALFGYLFFAETLSIQALIGCSLVLICVALIPKMTNFEKDAQDFEELSATAD